MNLRDRNLRIALLKAYAEAIDAALAAEKAGHRDLLVARYDEEGIKSADVKLPDGTKVASITLSIPKPTTAVTDVDALLEWAKTNAPELVVTEDHPAVAEYTVPAVTVPAQPAWSESRLDHKAVAAFVTRLKAVNKAEPGPVVDPDTGALVDGITYTPGARPKSYSVTYTDDGRECLARAYRAGDLSHVLDDSPLPAISPQEDQ